MTRLATSLMCFALFWLPASAAFGVTITGRAIDLQGRTIDNIRDLKVTAESPQGTQLNREKVKIDAAAGTYTLTIDDDLVRASGSALVILRFEPVGRLTLTVIVSGLNDQTFDAVLPTAEEMMEYMAYMNRACQPYYCPMAPMTCGWNAMSCCCHRGRRR